MVMPEMSGIELMKALRQRDVRVRVAVMTGYPLKEDKGLPPGVAGWLEKPLSLEQVARVVSEALQTSS
jgi:CheY-like chemotaxis protein